MAIEPGTVDSARADAQFIVHEFLQIAGQGKDAYQRSYAVLLREMLEIAPAELTRLRAVVEFAASNGCVGFLRKAHDIGVVMNACRTIETLVIPNMNDLQTGIHGIAGALRAIPEHCAPDGFSLSEGREHFALAAMRLECALDRNDVFGKVNELKAFAAANPDLVDRLILAIDDRQTGDLAVLQLMIAAGSLSDGAI